MQATDWLDTGEYPFANHYFETSAGKINYVDEGTGKSIIFLHGNPDWSFSYRKIIKALSKHHRCLAPDYLGFGLSDKPQNYDYKPWQLSRQIEERINHLQLSAITLVMNDWGGPVGMDFTLRNPERVHNLVIMNTWCRPLNGYPVIWLFSHFVEIWQNILPDTEMLKLAGAGHFPQECEPEQVSGAIRALLSNQST